MYNLHYRLWIAILIPTLSIGSNYPVLAKPQPPAKVILTSQVGKKAPITNEISPPPVEAVLASLKLKSSIQSTAVLPQRQEINRRSSKSIRVNKAQSLQGISNLTDPELVKSKSNNVSAVNQLIQ
jgi:hypothetical protein